jgi:Mrp family chromosome partitioning ATPase
MELSFVFTAIRRYWWVVVGCILLGSLGGLQLKGEDVVEFRSTSTLLMSAPAVSATGEFQGGGDRYVLGQLSVLQSSSLAESVANVVGQGLSAEDVSGQTEISQVVGTDVIEIVASSEVPEIAEGIARAYVDQYFVLLDAQITDAQADDVTELEQQLLDIRASLQKVDDEIKAIFANITREANKAVPTLDEIAPDLQSQRTILLAEYDRVAIAHDQLVLNGSLRVTSREVQKASAAKEVLTGSKGLLPVAGFISGALLGTALAALLAAGSRKSVDQRQIEEVLGRPIIGELPRARVFATARRSIVEAVPARVAARADEITVLAESRAQVGKSFTVLVVGAERGAGSTTLAGVLASRFATNGSQVLLIDVDQRDSELTRLFAAGSPGVEALLAMASSDGGRTSNLVNPFSPTSVAALSVVGMGDKARVGSLRRSVPQLVEVATQHAHVVVFDGGPLLDSASTVQLAQMVDAVVLAVPMRRLFTKSLERVGEQLGVRRDDVLPVLMPASRGRTRFGGRVDEPVPGSWSTPAGEVFVPVSERV